jgi:hypothetical protein
MKKETLTATVDPSVVLAKTKEIEHEVLTIQKQLGELPQKLGDEEDYKAACALLLDVVEKRKWVDKERDGFMEDVERLRARVEGWFARAYEQIAEVEAYFRGSVEAYALELGAKAHALREASAKLPARDQKKAKALLAEADALDLPRVGGISMSTKAQLEIVDEKKIPDRFFKRVVDGKLLIAALESGEKVAGAKLSINKSVRVTPSHAKKDA